MKLKNVIFLWRTLTVDGFQSNEHDDAEPSNDAKSPNDAINDASIILLIVSLSQRIKSYAKLDEWTINVIKSHDGLTNV